MAKVLVIDDSETVVQAVRASLSIDGHQVDQLDFFVDLARVLREKSPDIIVLDLDMPGFNGVRLGTFLRNRCHSDVPVIVYSSRPANDIEEAVRSIGACAGLCKNRPASELRQLVRQYTASAKAPVR